MHRNVKCTTYMKTVCSHPPMFYSFCTSCHAAMTSHLCLGGPPNHAKSTSHPPDSMQAVLLMPTLSDYLGMNASWRNWLHSKHAMRTQNRGVNINISDGRNVTWLKCMATAYYSFQVTYDQPSFFQLFLPYITKSFWLFSSLIRIT